ncbi:MAG: metallophosphoesterase [Elusimicrobiales bacterium]
MFPAFIILLTAAAPAGAASLSRGPYVEDVSVNSAQVRWRTDISTVAWLNYGPPPECGQFLAISPEGMEHEVSLYGLVPGGQLCYKVYVPESDGAVAASTGSFRTLRPPDQRMLSFAALGDSGTGEGAQDEIAARLEKYNPDFVIHTGDLTDNGLDSTADDKFFRPFASVMRKAPFFISPGNHEYAPPKVAAKAARNFFSANYARYHRMPQSPGSPHYYSFSSANALFVCLDTNYPVVKYAPSAARGSPQYLWLEQTLAKSAAMWKFVFLHVPLYSSGGHGSGKALTAALAPLFEKYGVDIVFQGHDHDYERTQPLKAGAVSQEYGVIYITLGGGGSPLYIKCSENPWSDKFASEYHFGVGEINGSGFKFTVYNRENKVIDSVAISK